ncbi:MAG: alanine racemase [Calditrichaeota bacterium]|nr:alanine racemase [Calditrichota bacterium]
MRPTVAEVDLTAIAANVQEVRKKVAPAQVMAVVKADAYGHGAVPVARVALRSGASRLAVALVEEALELREAGIRAPILVFGGVFLDDAKLFAKYDLEATVYTEQALAALGQAGRELGKPVSVHVKVDTGMGRVGVAWDEAPEFVEKVLKTEGVALTGLYTHFATSDEADKRYAHLQLRRFQKVLERLESGGVRVPLVHAANSGAILDLPEATFDAVRPGVMLYGYYPSPETSESVPLKPAMTFRTQVLYVKQVEPGTSVSYGRKYVAKRRTKIATLPVGYADGYNRLLSNQGEVLIRGRIYPVVGRVCMDQILVDLGPDSPVQPGDEVVLFGRRGDQEVSVYSICEKLHTIPYEVTCWVSKRVPRVYVGGDSQQVTDNS